MVNPTGYTALDMIGFTDQGTYSSSNNYVKNDLVHYSGNIWRCLIDDTTGIAPAEGANWTLFIGEPTNLVERIIAPVETDPATSAWAVGRQIIYNDNLYEVITAITAGDALVTYEDDPTNANIKLADPVETQLLNVKGNLSNRNLLDNAWFTVNQRGQSSYVTTANNQYTLDRWSCPIADTQVAINSDGSITISEGPSSSRSEYFRQNLDVDASKKLYGKILTASLIDDNNRLFTVTGEIPTSIPSSNVLVMTTNITDTSNSEIGRLNVTLYTNGRLVIDIITSTGKAVTVKAAKLELGPISTLAMDTAPNYAEELLKCQRYFVRIDNTSGGVSLGTAVALLADRATICIKLPVSMRAKPSVVGITNLQIVNGVSTIAAESVASSSHDNGYENLNVVATGTTQGTAYLVRLSSNTYIDFSADL